MISGIACLQYINLALIYPMIFMKWNIKIIRNPPGILQGTYTDFGNKWYMEVGYMIVITMVIEIVIPHAIPLCQIIYLGFLRCRDRGCSCDKKKSKLIL